MANRKLRQAFIRCYFLPTFLLLSYCYDGLSGASFKVLNITDTTADHPVANLTDPMPAYGASIFFNRKSNTKPIITILASSNYGGDQGAGPVCTKAMELALDRLKMQSNWLKNYELLLELIDDKCDSDKAIDLMLQKLEATKTPDSPNRIPLAIVPQCPTEGEVAVAQLVKHYNFIGITTTQNTAELTYDRRRFSSFFALAQNPDVPYIAMAEFMLAMGWLKVAIFSEIYPYFNQVEKAIVPILEDRNISLLWLGKVTYQSQDHEELGQAFREMSKRTPKIILQNTNSPASMCCWLYRFGMYGPNYAILSTDWSYFDPYGIDIPQSFRSWCTPDMLAAVLPSWIFFGDLSLRNMINPKFVDSTGLSVEMFKQNMKEKIRNAEQSGAWGFWTQVCYDQTLFTGYVVNATERILRETRNETLLDWTTDSPNFNKSGDTIVKILKEALYSVSVSGLMGDYQFDSATTINSLGFAPMIFSCFRKRSPTDDDGLLFDHKVIAYYKWNEKPGQQIVMTANKSIWLTVDQHPPRDSIHVIDIFRSPTASDAFGTLTAICSIEIFLNLLLLVLPFFSDYLPIFSQRIHLNKAAVVLLIGNIIMLSHVYALPMIANTSVKRNCTAIGFLLAIGFALSISAMFTRILNGKQYLPRTSHESSHFGSHYLHYEEEIADHLRTLIQNNVMAFCFIWTAIHLALFTALIIVAPIHTSAVLLPLLDSTVDSSIAYLPVRFECQMNWYTFQDSAPIGLVATIAVLHGGMLLDTITLAYSIRSIRRVAIPKDIKAACTCVYYEAVIIVAGIFIALMLSRSNQNLQILITVLISCITIVTTAQIMVTKVLRASATRSQAVRRTTLSIT